MLTDTFHEKLRCPLISTLSSRTQCVFVDLRQLDGLDLHGIKNFWHFVFSLLNILLVINYVEDSEVGIIKALFL